MTTEGKIVEGFELWAESKGLDVDLSEEFFADRQCYVSRDTAILFAAFVAGLELGTKLMLDTTV